MQICFHIAVYHNYLKLILLQVNILLLYLTISNLFLTDRIAICSQKIFKNNTVRKKFEISIDELKKGFEKTILKYFYV